MPIQTVVEVGNAPVTGISYAFDINDSGAVVGDEEGYFPFVWEPTSPNATTGTSTRLPCLQPQTGPGQARGINNHGDIVGFCTVNVLGADVTRAVLWPAINRSAPIDLGTLTPNPLYPGTFLGSSMAYDISDNGVIVGDSTTMLGVTHGFYFDPSTPFPMHDLFSLVPALMLPATVDPSSASCVEANGNIVGWATAVDSAGNLVTRAFLKPPGTALMRDLGTLVDDPYYPGKFLQTSDAAAINAAGHIVGNSDILASNDKTGAVFAAGVAPTMILPALIEVRDCNDSDEICGHFIDPVADRAYFLAPGNAPMDLSGLSLGRHILRANAINNHRQMAGVADVGGVNKAVLISI